jgi:hypothetical protein
LAVTAITTGTRYTIGRSALREWMAPHTTPDAFPGGVLASPVGTEIVAALQLLVENDEACGGLVFSCRGRIHTAAAYYAPSAGRDRYAGLHEAFRNHRAADAASRRAASLAAADVAARASSNVSTSPRRPETASSSTGRVTDDADKDSKNSASPPPPPPAAVYEAPPDTEADDIRRRTELLKVYRDLRRCGYGSPELAEHATRMTMTTDELAFAVEMLGLHEKRSVAVAAKTELCKLVAALVTAP